MAQQQRLDIENLANEIGDKRFKIEDFKNAI